MTRCNGCDAEWTSRKWEHCRVDGCHQTFAGTESGDAHRVGPHEPAGARRCLGADEMAAAGMWSTLSPRGVLVWHGRVRKDRTARRREVAHPQHWSEVVEPR